MGNAKSWAEFMTGRTPHLDKHKPIHSGNSFLGQSATGHTLYAITVKPVFSVTSLLFNKKRGSATVLFPPYFFHVFLKHLLFYRGHLTSTSLSGGCVFLDFVVIANEL